MTSANKLPIDTNVSAQDMAETMFGSGIEIVSSSYTGASGASGVYTDGDSIAPGVTPSDTGVILSTGSAEDITNDWGDANHSSRTTTQFKTAGDSDLSEIAGGATYDAAVIEAEFIPQGSVLSMQFTFSSEEYLEYCDSGFNDAVGVWVNGEKAEMTMGDGDISIDNINDESNSGLYIDNPHVADTYNTEMDGFTVTLTLKAPVNPGEINTIKIGIADAGDAKYDSNLLIAGDSVQTTLIAEDDFETVHAGETKVVDVLSNDVSADGGTLTITHINGQAVSAGDTVTLPSGDTITMGADGTFTVEGGDDQSVFSYTVANDAGDTDTAFVTLKTVACFVAGTLIDTPDGPRAVECLKPGDMVETLDHGPQCLRWRDAVTLPAVGRFAPVHIDAGALGDNGALALSPNHRVLQRSEAADLYFGKPEVLTPVKFLVNGATIRPQPGGEVEYVHLLFDRHEIVWANGLLCESYHPADTSENAFHAGARQEILDLFPGLEARCFPTARPVLARFEARLLSLH